MRTTKITALLFAMLSVAWTCVQAQSIKVTSVPEMGTYGQILGVVEGVTNPADYKITCLIDINDDGLNSRPQSSKPITQVEADGTFAVNFLSGGLDELSTMVHLYLIPVGIEVPVINQSTNVPPEIRNISVANVSIDRTSSKEEFVWCGTAWKIKDTADFVPVNPGPNFYSRENVWVDSSNRLHLKVAYTNGAWHCAEIVSTNSFGYGTYYFNMDKEISSYPGEIVFGIKTYDLEPDKYHKEMGFLFSNGDTVGGNKNWRYFISPTNILTPLHTFSVNWETVTKQILYWTPMGISFGSILSEERFPLFESWPSYIIERTQYNTSSSTKEVKNFGECMIQPGVRTYITNYVWSNTARSVVFRARATKFSIVSGGYSVTGWDTRLQVPPGRGNIRLGVWLANGTIYDADLSAEFEVIVSNFKFIPLDMKYIQPTIKVDWKCPEEIIELYIPSSK